MRIESDENWYLLPQTERLYGLFALVLVAARAGVYSQAPVRFRLLVGMLLSMVSLPLLAALPNGGSVSGVISSAGEQDSYTFTASVGDSIKLQMADTGNTSMYPWITVYKPGGSVLVSDYGGTVAGVYVNSLADAGTYTVVVGDYYGQYTGGYKLYFTRAPGANEGGVLPNGGKVSDAIDLGDLDSYTFAASVGDSIKLQMADTGDTSLTPWITVYKPDGAVLASDYGGTVAGVYANALADAGTYTVVVSDYYQDKVGDYDLYFTRAPGANEGGVLPNGGKVSDSIDLGDLDSYTFAASAGDSIKLQMADTGDTNLTPWITVYKPDGAVLASDFGGTVAGVYVNALADTGTYTVVVSDYYQDKLGDYDLYFTRAPDANEGGLLPNGGKVSDSIDLGDLDSYTFAASVGDSIKLQMADTGDTSLTPWITVYKPDGAVLASGLAGTVAGVYATALADAGTYTVVVSDYYQDKVGDYDLYFTRAPGANEGGLINKTGNPSGQIDLGDIDSYTLYAQAGHSLELSVADTLSTSLSPALLLYSPSGALVASDVDSTTAYISIANLAVSGTYTVLIYDGSSGNDEVGAYNSSVLVEGQNPGIVDADGDGLPDYYEAANGLDPNNGNDASADPDMDGLTNLEEFQAGTDPQNADTDGDGIRDDVDNDPLTTSSICGGANEILNNLEVAAASTVQCGASASILVRQLVMIQPTGRLELFAPQISFENGLAIPFGAELVTETDQIP